MQKNLYDPPLGLLFGVEIDTVKGPISIAQDILDQVKKIVLEWQNKIYGTQRQLQSLLGLLLHVHKCVKPARYFLTECWKY